MDVFAVRKIVKITIMFVVINDLYFFLLNLKLNSLDMIKMYNSKLYFALPISIDIEYISSMVEILRDVNKQYNLFKLDYCLYGNIEFIERDNEWMEIFSDLNEKNEQYTFYFYDMGQEGNVFLFTIIGQEHIDTSIIFEKFELDDNERERIIFNDMKKRGLKLITLSKAITIN